MIAFGCGAVAQKVFSDNNSWFTVSLAWGLGLIAAIYVAGGVSVSYPSFTKMIGATQSYRGMWKRRNQSKNFARQRVAIAKKRGGIVTIQLTTFVITVVDIIGCPLQSCCHLRLGNLPRISLGRCPNLLGCPACWCLCRCPHCLYRQPFCSSGCRSYHDHGHLLHRASDRTGHHHGRLHFRVHRHGSSLNYHSRHLR